MINFYLIKFLVSEVNEIYSYTSLDALYTAHNRKDVGVSKPYLSSYLSKNGCYLGKRAHIYKITAYNKTEVEENNNRPFVINC